MIRRKDKTCDASKISSNPIGPEKIPFGCADFVAIILLAIIVGALLGGLYGIYEMREIGGAIRKEDPKNPLDMIFFLEGPFFLMVYWHDVWHLHGVLLMLHGKEKSLVSGSEGPINYTQVRGARLRMDNVANPLPDPEIPSLDTDGLMLPPWVKFPNLPKVSMKWWMGRGQPCEVYRDAFLLWWGRQLPETRLLVQQRYPEPPEWTEFYGIGGIATPGMDPRIRRIWELIGALDEALWHRVDEAGFSMLEHLVRKPIDYRPESEEEIAIWNELTKPENYDSLVRHAEYCKDNPVNDYVAEISAVLLRIAARRCENESGQDRGASCSPALLSPTSTLP